MVVGLAKSPSPPTIQLPRIPNGWSSIPLSVDVQHEMQLVIWVATTMPVRSIQTNITTQSLKASLLEHTLLVGLGKSFLSPSVPLGDFC